MRPPGSAFGRGFVAGAVVAIVLIVLIGPLRDLFEGDEPVDRSAEALELIEDVYFEDPNVEKLEDASIRGMVRELRERYDDRFSHYFDPRTYRRFRSATSGEFSGVGMTVSEVERGLRVARVFEDTPAERAGITSGDKIVAVEGESIAGEAADVAASQIKGPPGTEVKITVVDGDGGERRNLTVERARVRVPAVEGRMVRIGGEEVAYVTLASFTNGAHGELREEVERLYEDGAKGLVLDLRGNGGGLLQEAVLTTSIFQEEGPVVTTEGRTRPSQTLDATGGALDPRPMAILVNGDTASASEIVAAALQENDLATVVGERTFGKGTFQEVIELEGGAALDLTVGEYLTADGTSLADEGVKPDIRVADDDPSDGDAVLRRALRELRPELG